MGAPPWAVEAHIVPVDLRDPSGRSVAPDSEPRCWTGSDSRGTRGGSRSKGARETHVHADDLIHPSGRGAAGDPLPRTCWNHILKKPPPPVLVPGLAVLRTIRLLRTERKPVPTTNKPPPPLNVAVQPSMVTLVSVPTHLLWVPSPMEKAMPPPCPALQPVTVVSLRCTMSVVESNAPPDVLAVHPTNVTRVMSSFAPAEIATPPPLSIVA